MKHSLFILLLAGGIFLSSFTGGIYLAKQQTESTVPCYAMIYPYDDRIGIYASSSDYLNGKEPLRIIDTPLCALPRQDQIAIQNGILLKSDAEVRQYTEDFGICLHQTVL